MEEGKTITTPHSLKNEFRNEVEKKAKSPVELETERVGEAEMLRRDQFVTMRQLQVQKAMMAKDEAFNLGAIDEYNAFLEELSELPLSDGVMAVEAMIKKQVEVLKNQVEQSKFARVNMVTLSALEEVFSDTDDQDDEPDELKDE